MGKEYNNNGILLKKIEYSNGELNYYSKGEEEEEKD